MRRIIFEVEDEMFEEMQKKIPWGQRRVIFETLTKDLLSLMDKYPPTLIIGALVSEEIGLSEITDYAEQRAGGNHGKQEDPKT